MTVSDRRLLWFLTFFLWWYTSMFDGYRHHRMIRCMPIIPTTCEP